MLAVDGRHTLYYEQCGNPDGKPVVILHGGPGGGCNAKMRRFHDPKVYRIIGFDQRGAGRSTPHADLVDNTTRSEEHTSELQSLMRISYAVFCLKKKKNPDTRTNHTHIDIDKS